MKRVITGRSVLFGFFLVAFIVVFEIVLERLKLPAWPAFMVMICFFIEHEDPGSMLRILIGGLAGIGCAVLLKHFEPVFAPYLGAEASRLLFIGVFVYAIVLFKDVLPPVFNAFAFLFFLVASIASRAPNPEPYVWMGVEIVVGSIFIAGILGINRLVDTILDDEEKTNEPTRSIESSFPVKKTAGEPDAKP